MLKCAEGRISTLTPFKMESKTIFPTQPFNTITEVSADRTGTFLFLKNRRFGGEKKTIPLFADNGIIYH